MKIKRSAGEYFFDVINTMIMCLVILVTLYPFIYILMASLSNSMLLMRHRGLLWSPIGFSINAYRLVFNNPMITTGYINTIVYLVIGLILNLFLTSLGAYGLSRKRLKLRKPIMFFITFTMFFSGGLIPSYLLVNQLGMANKIWAMVIPNAISTWNLIIMRTSFMAIPESLEESAKIDGANDFSILFRIVIPISMPVVSVMILFYGVGHWNSWFNAMIYLRNRTLYPLQLVLREILIINNVQSMTAGTSNSGDVEPIGESIKFATIMVSTLPILLLYPFLQRYFVKGVMIGAIKE